MLQFQVIGNLGGDAEFHNENGNQFISFRVGHTNRYTNDQGQTTEETTWVSCVLNGDGGKLLQYLVKGQKVCVTGDGSVRTYHSKKMQRLIAGANIFVRSIELVGARPDAVPSALFDENGVQVNVYKYFLAQGKASCSLFDRTGMAYTVDQNGWVLPPQNPAPDDATTVDAQQASATAAGDSVTSSNTQSAQVDDAPFTNTYGNLDEQAEESKKTTKKKSK